MLLHREEPVRGYGDSSAIVCESKILRRSGVVTQGPAVIIVVLRFVEFIEGPELIGGEVRHPVEGMVFRNIVHHAEIRWLGARRVAYWSVMRIVNRVGDCS